MPEYQSRHPTMTATSVSPGALLCLLAVVPSVLAFAPSSAGSATTAPHFHRHIPSTSTTALGYAASPLPLTNDPYVLLGLSTREGSRLSGSGSAPYDEKEVKRAFRRMTKLYHPDAVTTKDSTEDERRRANDEFARINAAYQAILDPEAEEAPKVGPCDARAVLIPCSVCYFRDCSNAIFCRYHVVRAHLISLN